MKLSSRMSGSASTAACAATLTSPRSRSVEASAADRSLKAAKNRAFLARAAALSTLEVQSRVVA
jgi:hypothetical protein